MRILLISTACLEVPPAAYGGLEMIVYDLADILNSKGHEVTVAAPVGSKLPEGIKLLETVDLKHNKWMENKALLKYINEASNSDIIHDHSHQKLIYKLFRDEYHCTYLSTLHCPDSILYPVLNPCLVTISKDHQERIYHRYGYKSIAVHNGIDISRMKYSEEKSDSFICLGRPNRFKGTLTAIEYCKELGYPLEVVGGMLEESPTEYVIKVARECLLGSMWRYWGAVTHKFKAELLSKARALIFPFSDDWFEPFGLIAPEALASGTPVITWNRGPFKETIIHGKTGFLADDPVQFKEYMKRVDEIDPKVCRREAKKKWSREVMTENYLKVYEKVLKGEKW